MEVEIGMLRMSWRVVMMKMLMMIVMMAMMIMMMMMMVLLRPLGCHLGLSEALLEPSWAILDAPTSRETFPPGPGGRG